MNNDYNGWTNWDTWHYLTWLTNDYDEYVKVQTRIRVIASGGSVTIPQTEETFGVNEEGNGEHYTITHALADYLKACSYEEADDELNRGASWVRGAVYEAIKCINFFEIAENLIEMEADDD